MTIAATGGDLTIIGSQISGDNIALAAQNNLNILSQAENHSLQSNNQNTSAGVGVLIGSSGFGFYAEAAVGKGNAHGNGVTHTDSTVDANGTLTLISGNDTTIKGAQLTGNQVIANIGNNLLIQSEQDTDDYASKQFQASGQVVIGMGGGGSGGGLNVNQSKINSHYASVTDVSGISAGDGGFDITVGGNTHLIGGVIASTADPTKNILDTGSLTYESIHNEANYSASSFGIGGGYSTGGGGYGGSGFSGAPNLGISQKGNSGSDTNAGIAQGTIIQRDGNTDLSGLDRNPTLDNQALTPIFDAQKVQEKMEMGQVAGQVGMTAAGDLATKMGWDEGSPQRTILHGVVGAGIAALGGGNVAQGALGAAANQLVIQQMADYLESQGYQKGTPEFATMLKLASTAVGAAAGGATGAAPALDGTTYNYLTHQQVDALNKTIAECGNSSDPSGCKASAVADAQKLSQQQDDNMIAACGSDPSGNACVQAKDIGKAYSLGAYYGYTGNGDQLAGAGPLMAQDVANSYAAYLQADALATPALRYGNPAWEKLIEGAISLIGCGGCDINYIAPNGSGEATPVAFPGEVLLYGLRVPASNSVYGTVTNATGNSGYMFDVMNPGPLPDKIAGTFAGGRYNVGVVEASDAPFFKAGDINSPQGSFFNFFPPSSVAQVRIDNAVLPFWTDQQTGALTGTSPLNSLISAQFPQGTVYYYGPVNTQGGVYLGGNYSIQIFVPDARSIGTFTPIGPLK